ncbi:hypothetical protein CEXT_781561 [Caerostris extrusa]|uniref:Uncharacterized protein n=1 Tax=Caerostris extrusa TaxID=172846 RepID=A0AAV4NZP4_CAEEX|nr:hypothetical protein CEXT_781561 [Caerostris extrusa]
MLLRTAEPGTTAPLHKRPNPYTNPSAMWKCKWYLCFCQFQIQRRFDHCIRHWAAAFPTCWTNGFSTHSTPAAWREALDTGLSTSSR